MTVNSGWTDDQAAQLRVLWAAGHSTAEIGRRLGVTKNSVVSKARRLNLMPRPSPIIRDGVVRYIRPSRLRGKVTLPYIAGGNAEAKAAKPKSTVAPAIISPERPKPAPYAIRRIDVFSAVRACCWPIGEPCTPSFRFCDDTPVVGKPYCSIHCRAAYLPSSRVNTDGIFRDEPRRAFVSQGQLLQVRFLPTDANSAGAAVPALFRAGVGRNA